MFIIYLNKTRFFFFSTTEEIVMYIWLSGHNGQKTITNVIIANYKGRKINKRK